MEPINNTPKVSPRVRTIAYFVSLFVGAAILVGTGVVDAFFPALSDQVGQVTASVSAAVALVIGGLGVAYRPTGKGIDATPVSDDYEPRH